MSDGLFEALQAVRDPLVQKLAETPPHDTLTLVVVQAKLEALEEVMRRSAEGLPQPEYPAEELPPQQPAKRRSKS